VVGTGVGSRIGVDVRTGTPAQQSRSAVSFTTAL